MYRKKGGDKLKPWDIKKIKMMVISLNQLPSGILGYSH